MALVDISYPTFDIETDIIYASKHNFTGKAVYGREACYLREEAAQHMAEAVKLANQLGLRFRIFDAFRPTEAQWILWNHTPDPNFLADPKRGSPHSRGVAVDLTLITKTKGDVLEMGTNFDEFSPLSHHGNTEINPTAQENRHLLMGIMTTAGWDFYRNEWWHYQLFNAAKYELLNDSSLEIPMMPAKN